MSEYTADSAIDWLSQGNKRFLDDRIEGKGRDGPRRKELTERQEPIAAILSCSDSRIAPEIAFDTGLGELFVVRVAGNVANTCSVASLEFAVETLGVKLIGIMGHENCGAVQAAIDGADVGGNLNHLLEHIRPVLTDEKLDADAIARRNTQFVAKQLLERSDIIRRAVEGGDVRIVTAFYHLQSGAVTLV